MGKCSEGYSDSRADILGSHNRDMEEKLAAAHALIETLAGALQKLKNFDYDTDVSGIADEAYGAYEEWKDSKR